MSSPEIIIAGDEDVTRVKAATDLCKHLGTALKSAYPGRNWFVDVNSVGKIAYICCPDISMRYGFYLHLNYTINELQRKAVMAGGEILERFKLSRNRDAVGGEKDLMKTITGESIHAASGGL